MWLLTSKPYQNKMFRSLLFLVLGALVSCGPDPRPNWASFLSKSEFKEVDQAFSNYALENKLIYQRVPGRFLIENKLKRTSLAIELDELTGNFFYSEPSEWKSKRLLKLNELGVRLENLNPSTLPFSQLESHLSLKLYSTPSSLQGLEKTIASNLYVRLVLDFGVFSIPVDQTLQRQGFPSEATLWSLAKNNLLRQTNRLTRTTEKWMEGFATYESIHDSSILPSSTALSLVENLCQETKTSFVFSIPNRQDVLIVGLSNQYQVLVLNQILDTTLKLYQGRPGPLSTNLYWYHENKIENIPYHFSSTGTWAFEYSTRMTQLVTKLLLKP